MLRGSQSAERINAACRMSKYFCYRCERTQGSCVRMASPQKKTPTTPSKKKTKRPASSSASSSASSTIAFPNIEGFSPKMQKEEQELIAYIHDLSHLKRNRGNTMDYYTMTLQTSSSENQEALLYSLSKRPLLQQSETTRTPVKLKNFTYTHDGQKLVINDMTNISTPQACEYSFQFTKIPRKENVVNVLDVLNSHDEWDMVSLQGKVLSVKEAREVGSPKKRLKLMEAVIADESGSVPLDVWESNIDQIKQGQVYKLNQVQVRVWSARKKLSTTLKTTIVPLEEPSLANIQRNTDTSDDVTTTITEFFSVTNIEKYLKMHPLW